MLEFGHTRIPTRRRDSDAISIEQNMSDYRHAGRPFSYISNAAAPVRPLPHSGDAAEMPAAPLASLMAKTHRGHGFGCCYYISKTLFRHGTGEAPDMRFTIRRRRRRLH